MDLMGDAFRAWPALWNSNGLLGVVFAHTDPDAWATLIEGLLSSGLVPSASWPIDTEMQRRQGLSLGPGPTSRPLYGWPAGSGKAKIEKRF